MKAKYKIIVNSVDNIRDLLQETYRLADEQIVQAQNEINKLANSTNLQEEAMKSKQQYAKAIQDYMDIKDKAISKKLDIAKLLTEIFKHNGNIEDTLNDSASQKNMSIDFSKIKELVDSNNGSSNDKKVININKTR